MATTTLQLQWGPIIVSESSEKTIVSNADYSQTILASVTSNTLVLTNISGTDSITVISSDVASYPEGLFSLLVDTLMLSENLSTVLGRDFGVAASLSALLTDNVVLSDSSFNYLTGQLGFLNDILATTETLTFELNNVRTLSESLALLETCVSSVNSIKNESLTLTEALALASTRVFTEQTNMSSTTGISHMNYVDATYVVDGFVGTTYSY